MKIPGDAAGWDGALNKLLKCSKFGKIAVKIEYMDTDICRENVKLVISIIFFFQLHLRGADPG